MSDFLSYYNFRDIDVVFTNKKVTFNNRIFIALIPSRKEYDTFRDQIWYSARDYMEFTRIYQLEMSINS
jgi:hypothetical protein